MPIDPEIWGKHVWNMLHWFAAEVPLDNKDKAVYEQFGNLILHMGDLIPCPTCKSHFSEVLTNVPYERFLEQQKHVREWLLALHNKVNEDEPAWSLSKLDQIFVPSEIQKQKEDDEQANISQSSTKQADMAYIRRIGRRKVYSRRSAGTMGYSKVSQSAFRGVSVQAQNTRNYLVQKAKSKSRTRRGCGCGK